MDKHLKNDPNMPLQKLLFCFLLCCFFSSSAQDFQRIDADVFKDGIQLRNPLTGGLKSPQYSEVDLNGDGTCLLYTSDAADE